MNAPWHDPDMKVVLFDGVCNLCCGWISFLAARDPAAHLKLASLQSDVGRAISTEAGLSTDDLDTMLFVEGGRIHRKSGAFLRVARHLRWPWPVLALGLVVPRVLRDWCYDRVARNRYRWFGKRDTCLLPTPELERRFLTKP